MKTYNTLDIHNLSVLYAGQDEPALDQITLSLKTGQICAVIGPNGAGKSTLIKSILGLIPKQSGEIQCFGQSIETQRRKIAYIPQRNAIDWNFPISVQEVVQLGLFPDLKRTDFFTPKRHKDIALHVLEQLGLGEMATRQISKLSGGQQQRMFIARALAQSMMPDGAEIFLMDEPFTGIDAATEKVLIGTMKALATEGKSIMAVHHNLATVSEIFSDIILLNRRLIAMGSTESTFTEDNIKRAFLPPVSSYTQRSHPPLDASSASSA